MNRPEPDWLTIVLLVAVFVFHDIWERALPGSPSWALAMISAYCLYRLGTWRREP